MEYLNSLTIISEENIEEATQILIEELAFSNNIRGSKEYRIELTKAYIRRGLKKVINYVD
jgi:CO/xanthine dehydrogenase FAD-binding subunit